MIVNLFLLLLYFFNVFFIIDFIFCYINQNQTDMIRDICLFSNKNSSEMRIYFDRLFFEWWWALSGILGYQIRRGINRVYGRIFYPQAHHTCYVQYFALWNNPVNERWRSEHIKYTIFYKYGNNLKNIYGCARNYVE
jgi:hypothetical protein